MEAGYADGYVMAGMALSGIEQKMQTLVKPELFLCLHLVFTFYKYDSRLKIWCQPSSRYMLSESL